VDKDVDKEGLLPPQQKPL